MSTILEWKVKQLVDRTAISDWLPYEAWDDTNQVYRLDDGRIGVVFSSKPLLGLSEESIQKLTNLFESDLPIGTTFQFMLHASPIIEPYLDNHVILAQRGQAGERYVADARKTAEFYLHARDTQLTSNPPLRPRDFTVYVSVAFPTQETTAQGWEDERIHQAVSGIEGQLNTLGLLPERVGPLQLLSLLHVLLNPGHSWESRPPAYSDQLPIRDQAVRLDTKATLRTKMIELDGKFLKTLTVQSWPVQWHGGNNRELIGSLIRFTDQITCPFFLTLNVLKFDQVKAKGKLRKKHVIINQQASGFLLGLIPSLKFKLDHFNGVQAQLENGRQLIGSYFQVVLYGDTPRHVEEQTGALRALYRAKDINLQEDHFIGWKILMTGLPLGLPSDDKALIDGLRRMKTYHTEVPAHICPIVADWKGGGAPVVLLTSRSGQLITMDVFANQQTNYNMAIAATSGAGKSFFMNNWIKSYLGIGGQVWVIDAGFSYVKLVELLKGQYIQYGANAQRLCFNPFSKLVHWGSNAGGVDDPSDRADELATLKALHAQMASPSRPLSDVELSFIEEAIMRVLEGEGCEGCPDSVHKVLKSMTDPRARDLARVLASYAKGGMYSHLFNGANNVNFENDFVVLELDGLNEQKQLRSVILLQMQMNIQAVMYKKENRGRRKFVILDEAWDLLSQGGNTAAFFETGARRVRKSGGSMITITQGINDYYDKMRDVGRYLLENAEFVGLLKQKTESIAAFRNNGRIVLSEMEYRLLSSVTKTTEYPEIFMITPFGRGICRLTVPRETQLLFTTNPDELSMIDRVRKEGPKELSIDEAIQCIIAAERAQAGADNPRLA